MFQGLEPQEAELADDLRLELEAIDPDALSPKAALEALYRLKALAADPEAST